MKKFCLFIFVIISSLISAQMDVEHWFAPMGSNYPSSQNFQAVYLSTSETTKFKVKIFSGNIEIGEVEISKGNPGRFEIPRDYIITEEPIDRMIKLNKGLHLTGEKKFFANLRFSVQNHAEIVTSKGLAGVGKTFYLGAPPVQRGSGSGATSNHTVSVIATENGTSVTLSGYQPDLIFTNDATQTSEKTFTLNKGESYILEVNNDSQALNQGLIGAKIESDKPVSVSNGSFSGRIGDNGIDIFMDQAIPVERTGEEFIVMSGNGRIENSSDSSVMEKTLIIATVPGTEVFLNGNISSTPDFVLAKPGDYRLIESSLYFPADTADNVFGLHLKTSEKAYVYQLLAGSSDNELASGGMNIIPALSCFLPSSINEISNVDENPVYSSYSGGSGGIGLIEHHNVKLNLIAQAGSDLYVNGSKDGLLGPFTVPGTNEWEVYSLLGAKGNITVTNSYNKAVTAGIAGGSENVGFGGYFAGFSSVPVITKSGDCAKGQLLQVDDIYDEYKWEYSPDNIAWENYTGSGAAINPDAKFGYYRCTVTKYSCQPAQTTKEFKYLKCTEAGAPINKTIGHCEDFSIVPEFTHHLGLAINPDKTTIISAPSSGKAYIDHSGNVIFEADDTTESTVTFSYYFESFGDFPDSEEVTVTVNIPQIDLKPMDITECVDTNGEGQYDLTAFERDAQNAGYKRYEYYKDQNFTERIEPPEKTTGYQSKPQKTVYVKVFNIYECYRSAEITLKTFELPTLRVETSGQNATLFASGGTPPYRFTVTAPGHYQSSGPVTTSSYTFTNVPYGKVTASVTGAENCTPTELPFSVLRLLNVITPNGDGYNDELDYSGLIFKEEPLLKIYDRYGALIFTGNASNNYTWNGLYNGRQVSTGTYWYFLQWRDPGAVNVTTKTGWILVKNE